MGREPDTPSSTVLLLYYFSYCSCCFRGSVFCRHLKAEVAKIKRLEVDEITTTGHDIAYYLKVRPNLLGKFGEGDVVGFFESDAGDTDIDFLTSENSARARMAGVISRSAYVKGKAGASDHGEFYSSVHPFIHPSIHPSFHPSILSFLPSFLPSLFRASFFPSFLPPFHPPVLPFQ